MTLLWLLAAALIMTLTACSTTPTTATPPNFKASIQKTVRESIKPITFSGSRDAPETVRQIREHNAALEILLGNE